jgi:ABC-type bacteriocin/lantibiotic exporter with double-glycine peptidase domain
VLAAFDTLANQHVALNEYLKSSKAYDIFSRLTSLAQGFILACGLTGVLCLGAWQVAYEGQSVGSFTTLLMFWGQLQSEYILQSKSILLY